jgi:outer membrane protein, heavy metal efflux system
MNTHRMIAAVLVAFSIAAPAVPQERDDPLFPEGVLQRTALIEEVLERNPDLRVARNALRAALEQITQARSLEDPRAAVAVAPLTLDAARPGAEFELSQTIPWPGRLAARTSMATAGAEMRRAELDDVRVELALRASMLFDRWYYVHRAFDLNLHHREIVAVMKLSAESRYIVGAASQQDPLQAEVRLTRLIREAVDLETQRRTIRYAINALLHRSPTAAIPPPPEVLPIPPVPSDAREALREAVVEGQPMIEAARAKVREAEAGLRLAELEKRPDLMAMATFSSMWMDRDERVMVGVGFRLPVRRQRIEAGIRQARERLEGARASLDSREDQALFRLEEALEEARAAIEVIRLHEDQLIPASRDQTEAAQAGFTTGRNSFLAVIQAEANLEEVLLAYHRALTDVWGAVARVEAALGITPFAGEEMTDEYAE